jgi:hypothetical protein
MQSGPICEYQQNREGLTVDMKVNAHWGGIELKVCNLCATEQTASEKNTGILTVIELLDIVLVNPIILLNRTEEWDCWYLEQRLH